MRILDENGRLFGSVNVFDAAVVVAVVVAIAAGVVLVGPVGGWIDGGGGDDGADGPGSDRATRYATVDLGERPPALAERVTVGDVAAGERPSENLTVTDTYVGPASGDNVSVVVRVRVDGTLADGDRTGDGTVAFGDQPLGRGSDLGFETGEYEVGGTVLAVDATNATLQTRTLPVLVETSPSRATAAHVEPGDAFRIDGRAVAEVTGAVLEPAASGRNRSGVVGLRLQTIRHSGHTYFGDTRVLVGQRVEFRTDRYALSGTVARWGDDSLPGEPTTRTVVVAVDDADPDVVDGLEAGQVARRDGTTVARLVDVHSEPASVVVTGADGQLYEREHPRNRDVTLAVELRVRRTEDGLRFRTRSLHEGAEVALDFRTIVVEGTVIDVEP